jgi:serine protease
MPNDPFYSEQWSYYESAAGIRLPAAWDGSIGAGVTVAVLDTGYLPHAELAGQILSGYDFIATVAAVDTATSSTQVPTAFVGEAYTPEGNGQVPGKQ